MKFAQKKLKGLSLLEVMVSMGIFSMMMVSVAGIFGSSIQSSRANRNIEHDLENAQFVMNDIAKQLRTSTIVLPAVNSTVIAIQFYDYSQGRCVHYEYDGTSAIRKKSASVAYVAASLAADCNTALGSVAWQTVTTGHATSSFVVTRSVLNTTAGKVTMVFVVKERAASTRTVRIQTTVSLRDYAESGVVQAD